MKEKYESLSLQILRQLASARGLVKISKLKKAELIDLMLAEDEKDKNKEREQTQISESGARKEKEQHSAAPVKAELVPLLSPGW